MSTLTSTEPTLEPFELTSPSCPGVEVTGGSFGSWSCCLVLTVAVEDLAWGAAAHEVTVVASVMVVGDEPGVGLGLELADAGEAPAVECWTPALLQGGAVEA